MAGNLLSGWPLRHLLSDNRHGASMRLVLLALVIPTVAASQTRKIESEIAGSVFFGNTRQTLASTRAMFERKDSAFAFRTGARFNYGEMTQDVIGTIVNKRSWDMGANYDWRPLADFTRYLRSE